MFSRFKKNFVLTTKSGFTLSEVLITLVIIGVIAAITVPIIISNYNEQVIKSALKKNYGVLKNALNMYQLENGVRLTPRDDGEQHEAKELKNKIIKYFNVARTCEYYTCMDYTHYQNKTGTSQSQETRYYLDDGQFVLNDGTILLLEDNKYSFFSVDINGEKGPNRLGVDVFTFQLMKDGEILPMGAKGTIFPEETYCSNTSNHPLNGIGCAQKMLM